MGRSRDGWQAVFIEAQSSDIASVRRGLQHAHNASSRSGQNVWQRRGIMRSHQISMNDRGVNVGVINRLEKRRRPSQAKSETPKGIGPIASTAYQKDL